MRWARAMRPVPRRLSNTCRAYEPAARCASPRPPGGCLYIPANCSSVSPAQSVDFNLRVRGRRLETATGTLRIRSCEDERTSGMSGAWRDNFLYQSDDLGGWTGWHVWPAGEVPSADWALVGIPASGVRLRRTTQLAALAPPSCCLALPSCLLSSVLVVRRLAGPGG